MIDSSYNTQHYDNAINYLYYRVFNFFNYIILKHTLAFINNNYIISNLRIINAWFLKYIFVSNHYIHLHKMSILVENDMLSILQIF